MTALLLGVGELGAGDEEEGPPGTEHSTGKSIEVLACVCGGEGGVSGGENTPQMYTLGQTLTSLPLT